MANKPLRKAKPGHHWIKLVSPEGEEWIEAKDPDPALFYFVIPEECGLKKERQESERRRQDTSKEVQAEDISTTDI